MKRWVLFILLLPAILLAEFTLVDQSPNHLVLEFTLEDFTEYPVQLFESDYVYFDFKDAVTEELPGEPLVPFVNTRVAIPEGARVECEILEVETETRQGVDLMPQSLIYLRGEMRQAAPSPEIYNSPAPYPQDRFSLSESYLWRKLNVVGLRFNPIQYYPALHQVEIVKRAKLLIKFLTTGNLPVNTQPRPFTAYEKRMLGAKLANVEQAEIFGQQHRPSFNRLSVNYDFSNGQWFKIPIKKEGIYQISGAALRAAGVNLSEVPAANLHLYNYGGFALPWDVNDPRPEDLNELAVEVVDENNNGIFDDNDRLIFYGKGLGGWRFNPSPSIFDWEYYGAPVDKTSTNNFYNRSLFPYDDTNYYLLTWDNSPGKRIVTEPSPQISGAEVVTQFKDYAHFEEDKYNILSSGPDWYWIKMSGVAEQKHLEFTMPENLADAPVRCYFRFKGGSGSLYGDNGNYDYWYRVMINGVPFLEYSQSNPLESSNFRLSVVNFDNLNGLKSGKNDLDIDYTGNTSGCESYLDYFEIYFYRQLVASSSQLHFRHLIGTNQAKEYRITGMPAGNHRVWNLSDYANISAITPLQNGSTIVFQDQAELLTPVEYYVFADDAIQPVPDIQTVPNHPNLRDPQRRAEFIIITPDEFYEDARFLEDWRESQLIDPLITERVKLSEIFLEFSSGVRDVTAIRDFLRYAYYNWSDTLKYVLLFGDGHYDYRGIQIQNYANFIPPFEIYNKGEVDSRESDNFYVAFGLTGNLDAIDPDLPIARLPFNSTDQIEVFRKKEEAYLHSYLVEPEKNGWQMSITLVSDDQFGSSSSSNELSWHLKPTEEISKYYLPKKFVQTKIYLHDYEQVPGGLGRWKPKATEDLLNRINRGTLLISFFGHGNPDTWAHESVINRSRDLPQIVNNNRLPLWVAATCTWGKYDDPNNTSMSEELVWLPERGGIGVISAARPVFVYSNTVLAKNFYKHLFNSQSNSEPSHRLGDALFKAMQPSRNYQKYHLYTDPTIRLADPEYQVKIESVSPDTLKALSTVNVGATIRDHNGNLMSDFNGYAVIQAFDAVDSMYTDINNINLHYVYSGGTIFKGLVTVKNGYLQGSFIVPKSIKYKDSPTGRINIYAWSEDKMDAGGFLDTLLITGTEVSGNDQNGPEIEVAFKEQPNFFDGDYISSQPTLVLNIRDENGINLTGEVGHRIELQIDGAESKNVTDFFVYETDSYQEGRLEYTLPALSSGFHELKISCWDNLNNYSERTVTFRTSATTELELVEVVNYPNPMNEDTYFTFKTTRPAPGAEVRISIYTVAGRKIQDLTGYLDNETFVKIYWDGRDYDGDQVANGVYLYKVKVRDGDKTVEKIDKIAVVR